MGSGGTIAGEAGSSRRLATPFLLAWLPWATLQWVSSRTLDTVQVCLPL